MAASTDIESLKSTKSRLSSVISEVVITPSAISSAPMEPVGKTTSPLPVPSVASVMAVVVAEPMLMEVAMLVPIFNVPAAATSINPVPSMILPLP